MIRKKKKLAALVVVAAAIVAFFVLTAPRHALICRDIIVGEEVLVTSQGVPLGASLLRPKAAGKAPGVVAVVGSGSYSYRDSWRPGAFPLWKNISEALLDKGYAVLLLEKKGINGSGGHWETQTFWDRAQDAVAGVRYLRARPDIDPERVGVCGHSQGGWIAQLAAAEAPGEVAFVINLAGPNVSVKRQVIDDQENEWRCAGVAEDKMAGKSRRLKTKLDTYGALSRVVKIGSLSRIINYDPAAENVPARIKCPLLAIYGENDMLVVPEGNIPLLERGLAAGGNTRYRIVIIPAGTHGFTKREGKCPKETQGIPDMAPEFFQALAAWDPFSP